MLRTTKFIFTVFIPILLFGCHKEIGQDLIVSDIKINMQEQIDSTNRKLEFDCTTKNTYPCYNYKILHSLAIQGNTIEISFERIEEPYIGLNTLGPARARINLGSLRDGVYQLTIFVGNRKSEGHLVVTSDYYEVTLHKVGRVEIVTPVLYR